MVLDRAIILNWRRLQREILEMSDVNSDSSYTIDLRNVQTMYDTFFNATDIELKTEEKFNLFIKEEMLKFLCYSENFHH